ncbi:MAG: HAMP domain-containing protein [bacterium]|nr:HAMP domain-containing protein [bacterium]
MGTEMESTENDQINGEAAETIETPEAVEGAEAPKHHRKKFRISIRNKLLFIISLIIVVSLSTMIILASYSFRKDSSVQINSNNLRIAQVTALKVETDFKSLIKLANFISTRLVEESRKRATKADIDILAKNFFQDNRDIVYIGIAKKGGGGGLAVQESITNKKFLKEKGIAGKTITTAVSMEKDAFKKSFNMEQVVNNVSPHLKIPTIGISIPYIKKSEISASSILIVFISMDRFNQAVASQGGITKTAIVNSEGYLLAHEDKSMVISKPNLRREIPLVEMMMTSQSDNGNKQYKDNKGVSYLGSFKKIKFANIGVITFAEVDRAFEAVYRLQKQNILLTIIVLSLALLIVYYFARGLTTPIKRLVSATREIEQGEFEVEFDDKKMPGDEIGLLMRSFRDMGQGLAEREKMKDALGKFVNPEIARMAMEGEIELGGERKEVAIFFSDIRSFTAISENLEPEEVVEFLNQYMTRMVDCVDQTNGVVDKFIGDAVMAVWGAPVSHGNDTENAINGSLMMRKSLMEFNVGRGGPKKPIIKIGSGINTGAVLAGQIGSDNKMEYTVIGDAVNLASRIEALNKPFGTDVLISQDSYNLVEGIYYVEKMQAIKVKGKKEPQQIYAVLGRKDDPESPTTLAQVRELLGIEHVDLNEVDVDAKEEKFEILDDTKKEKGKE